LYLLSQEEDEEACLERSQSVANLVGKSNDGNKLGERDSFMHFI